MKTGDIILNTHAGDRNPDRVVMVFGHAFGYIHCLSRTGRTLKFYASDQRKESFLKVIGHVDLSEIFAQFQLPEPTEGMGVSDDPD